MKKAISLVMSFAVLSSVAALTSCSKDKDNTVATAEAVTSAQSVGVSAIKEYRIDNSDIFSSISIVYFEDSTIMSIHGFTMYRNLSHDSIDGFRKRADDAASAISKSNLTSASVTAKEENGTYSVSFSFENIDQDTNKAACEVASKFLEVPLSSDYMLTASLETVLFGCGYTENVLSSDNPTTDTTPVPENLENLESAGETSIAEFVLEMDETLGSMKVQVAYYKDTGVVYGVYINGNISPTHPSYEDRLKEDEAFANDTNAKKDSCLTAYYNVDSFGVQNSVFEVLGLASEDRASRIEFVRDYIGAIPDTETYAFYFDDMNEDLANQGFSRVS